MSRAIVRIVESRAVTYRVPESLASHHKHTNMAVALTCQRQDGTTVEGSGEGQPRGWVTGDNAPDSWGFVTEIMRRLEGVQLPIDSPVEALRTVRAQMEEFFDLGAQWASESVVKHPYRGSLLAVETALLDVAAAALDISLEKLLAADGSSVLGDPPVEVPGPAAGTKNGDPVYPRARSLVEFDDVWVPGAQQDDLIQALLVLELASQEWKAAGSAASIGVDLGGVLELPAARAFVRHIIDAVIRGDLPEHVVLERVVPRNRRSRIQLLQDDIQSLLRSFGRRDITIKLHQQWRHWDHETPSRQAASQDHHLAKVVRPAQFGSLLRVCNVIDELVQNRPNCTVIVADLPGATSLTRAALRSLGSSRAGISALVLEAAEGGEFAVGAPRTTESAGHGAKLAYEAIVGDAREMVTFPPPPAPTYEGRPVAVYDDVDHLHPLGPNGSKGHLLERQALAMGLTTTRYSKGAFRAGDENSAPLIFKWSRNPLSSAAALALCTHKEGTRMQLQRAGVPVPQGRTFANGDFATARQFVQRIGFPVVVKPAMGVRGIGVVAGIRNEKELEAAFEIMASSKLGKQDFIVEKHISGRDYRIVVVGDKVIAAIQREPASVFGDGESTVAELLLNKNIARKRNPHLWARPAKYDAAAKHELQKAGKSLSSVPAKGERVLLANTCSLSQGGDSIDVLDELHPSIIEACVKAVNAIPQLEYCGVDFLLEDHTKSLDEQDAGICELNAHAAIGNCEYPMFGQGRAVAQTVMRACVEHYGLDAKEPAAELALHLTIRGKVTGVGFRRWLSRRAEASGVSGWVHNIDRKTVEAVLVGETVATTAVAAATILGPRAAVPTSYVARHIEKPDVEGFAIRENANARVRKTARKVVVRAGREARRLAATTYRLRGVQKAGKS